VADSVLMSFGEGTLELPVAPGATVVRPRQEHRLPDVARAVTIALREPGSGGPLASLLADGMSVAISICDGTRAYPWRDVLSPLLDEIDDTARDCDVTLVVATGSHRANTPQELRAMLGEEIVERCRVECHDSRDDDRLDAFGTVAGDVPLYLNRTWARADVRLTAGVVEPHFFAGFSGGPKMVAPGLAGLDTILALHSFERIAHPNATWGVTDSNPVHDAIALCAERVPPHVALDVRVNRELQVCDLAAGELGAVHRSLCERARTSVMAAVEAPFDIVVTSNGGYPLDQNLYQAVKGLAAAERIIHDGSTIILVAECRDGMPEGSRFSTLLSHVDSPQALVAALAGGGPPVPDQWQAQVLGRILSRARVLVHATGLSPSQLRAALLEPASDPAEAVRTEAARWGRDVRVAYLPDGPYTVPYPDGAGGQRFDVG
jgi:lactate racemase